MGDAPTMPAESMSAALAVISAVSQGDKAAAVDVLNTLDPQELAGCAYMAASIAAQLAQRLPGGVELILGKWLEFDAGRRATPPDLA